MRYGGIGAVVLVIILIVGLLLVCMCTEKIPAGYVGVVYNMNGGVDGEVLGQGWHIVAPTKKVTTYSIGIEQSYLTAEDKGDSPKDESFSIPTSDGKTVKVNLEFSYRFDEERVAETFTKFKGKSGEDIKDTFIKPKIAAVDFARPDMDGMSRWAMWNQKPWMLILASYQCLTSQAFYKI